MHGSLKRGVLTATCLLLAVCFAALGIWQVERRAWKLRLIATVDARAHAAPVAPPGPGAWRGGSADRDAYRRVRVAGRFDGGDTLVQAVTERGGGFWVLTPLRTAAGWRVMVNRGFVPAEGAHASRPAEAVMVTGLLRITEPGGGFLRANDPAAGRWYSRDVAAIARSRGLTGVAPYFIDADATPGRDGYPIGGLTVIAFRNAHLIYALTWFALAALSGYGAWRVRRES